MLRGGRRASGRSGGRGPFFLVEQLQGTRLELGPGEAELFQTAEDGHELLAQIILRIGWPHADLEAMGSLLDKEADQARSAAWVGNTLKHWQVDPDLAGVRGPEALAKQPEAERQSWRKLWDDAADVLARAQTKTTPEKKSDAK